MISSNRVLIVDEMNESIRPLLEKAGFAPDYKPIISRDEILKKITNYTGLVIRGKTWVDKELIDRANGLKFVARAGAGSDMLDVQYLEKKEISIVNAPEGNRDALGEHALGMLLGLLHKINAADCEIRRGDWRREANRGMELRGKTVGLYGFGYMGESFAEKLSGLSCEVIAYDKYRTGFSNDFVKEVSLEELQQRTEILSIHVRLTNETRYLFDKHYLMKFSKMKVLLNTARGKMLKVRDALTLLEEGVLCGMGLDVLENEKLETYNDEESALMNALIGNKQVIMTPHIGGWTFESYERINEVLVNKIIGLGIR